MKKLIFIILFSLLAGTAVASIIIQGNMQIKLNVGTSSSSGGSDIGAITQEDTGLLLKEDGGALLYD